MENLLEDWFKSKFKSKSESFKNIETEPNSLFSYKKIIRVTFLKYVSKIIGSTWDYKNNCSG